MAKYIIVNRSQSKCEGKVRHYTRYYCGVMAAGGFLIERWDSNKKKDAYVFDNKAVVNRYFREHRLDAISDAGWCKTGYNRYQKDVFEVIKL